MLALPWGKPHRASITPRPGFGLSDAALKTAALLFSLDTTGLHGAPVGANQLLATLQMDRKEVEDAVMELSDKGLAEVKRYLNVPASVRPQGHLSCWSLTTIPRGMSLPLQSTWHRKMAVWSGQQLHEATGLPVPRLNRAVRILGEEGLLNVLNTLGTAPFAFQRVSADYRTRKFVRDNT